MYRTTALYARVSSERQAQEGIIDSQLDALRAFLAHQGWTVDPGHEFVDNGCSGAQLERPALERLRDAIAKPVANWCWSKSRRSTLRKTCWPAKSGVYLLSTNALRCWNAPAADACSGPGKESRPAVRPGATAIWPGKVLPRLAGKSSRLKPSGYAPSSAGYGKRIWDCMPSSAGFQSDRYPHPGVERAGRPAACRGSWRTRPIEVRSSISAINANTPLKKLARHRQLAQRHAQPRRYWLQGLLRCERCGRRLAGKACDRYLYYRCRSQREVFPHQRCRSAWIRADQLEAQVWQAVQELVLSPEQVWASYREQRQARLQGKSQTERQALEQEAERLEQRRQRILAAYELGAVSLDELVAARKKQEQAQQDLAARQQDWEQRQQAWEGFAEALNELVKYRDTV